jgi:hypothetical protein
MSSVRFRGLSQTARALECEAMTGHIEDVIKRLVGGVRDIDDHSQPVALGDDPPSEFAQPFVLGILAVRGGVADVVVRSVAQRDVPHALLVKEFDEREIQADRVAVLHPDEGRELPLSLEAIGVARGEAQPDHRRIVVRHLMDGINDPDRRILGLGIALRIPGSLSDESGEELRVQPALLHPGKVDLPALALRRIVALADLPVRAQKVEGCIAMRVHGEHLLMECAGLRLDARRGMFTLAAGQREEGEAQQDGKDRSGFHGASSKVVGSLVSRVAPRDGDYTKCGPPVRRPGDSASIQSFTRR